MRITGIKQLVTVICAALCIAGLLGAATKIDWSQVNVSSAQLQTTIGAGVYDASGAAAARAGTGNCSAGQYETGDATGGPTCAPITPQVVDCHTACSPTAAQLSNAQVSNYGQAAANVQITGPTVAAGMNFIMVAGTAQASNYWRYTSTTANIYLDGSSTAVTNIIFAAPGVGNSFACLSFQIGSSTYALSCTTRNGTSTSS